MRALRPEAPNGSRKRTAASAGWREQAEALAFYFVMAGELNLLTQDEDGNTSANQLTRCDSVTLPGGQQYRFSDCSSDLMLLEVLLHVTGSAV